MYRSELELKKGSILRKEVIEEIYVYPRIITETYYAKFSDGILYGLEWVCSQENKGHHFIMPGALKYHGEIYYLPERIDVEEALVNEIEIDKYYRLCFEEEKPENTVETLTYFNLKLRAVLSNEYEEIKEHSFLYSRVRVIEDKRVELFYKDEVFGLYASDDGYNYKFPQWIIEEKKLFDLLVGKENKHPLDFLVLKEISEKKGLSLSLISLYLSESGVGDCDVNSVPPQILIEKFIEAIKMLKFTSVVVQTDNAEKPKQKIREPEGRLLI